MNDDKFNKNRDRLVVITNLKSTYELIMDKMDDEIQELERRIESRINSAFFKAMIVGTIVASSALLIWIAFFVMDR